MIGLLQVPVNIFYMYRRIAFLFYYTMTVHCFNGEIKCDIETGNLK